MIIETGTGRQFKALWAGVSTIDDALRFEIYAKNLTEILRIFSDVTETSTIKIIKDNMTTPEVYTGYTNVNSIGVASSSTIVVALKS